MTDDEDIPFGEALEPTDFGFIVCGKTGHLKGLWIPTEMQDQEVPENIIELCVNFFGISRNEFFEDDDDEDSTGKTLH